MTRCDQQTNLTDAEIASVVRGAAVNGIAGPFEAIDTTAECRLHEHHDGDCASYQASLRDEDGTAWLRWGEDRRIDWLADCTANACILYRGHPGQCHGGKDGRPEPGGRL